MQNKLMEVLLYICRMATMKITIRSVSESVGHLELTAAAGGIKCCTSLETGIFQYQHTPTL